MSDAQEAGVDEDVEEDGEQPEPKKGSKRKLLLIALPLVLVLIGGGAGAYFMGALDSLMGGHADGAEMADAAGEPQAPSVYYDLPEMLVNLNTSGRRNNYLRVVVSLELAGEDDVARVEEVMPRVIDNFQVFLRELRVEDLRGSAGMYRLREELLLRVSAAARPADVRDVLFREMLVQ